jgi:hypothetical protein
MDKHFRSFMSYLDPSFKLPSPEDIDKMRDDIGLGEARNKLRLARPTRTSTGVPSRLQLQAGSACQWVKLLQAAPRLQVGKPAYYTPRATSLMETGSCTW